MKKLIGLLKMHILRYTGCMNKTKKVAIIGVSEDERKYGHRIFADLLKSGYDVEGVNPKGGLVHKKELFTELSDIDPKPEIVVVVVPPEAGLEVLEECADLGITEVWMQPGAESREAMILADQLGLNLTTACFMTHEGIW